MKTKSRHIVGASFALFALASQAQAAAVAYKADKTVGDKELKGAPVSISVDSKDTLYVLTDSGNAADAAPMDAMSNQAEMERHHRQAMDHDAMRAGAGNQTAPAPDPAPGNAAMPMKDM